MVIITIDNSRALFKALSLLASCHDHTSKKMLYNGTLMIHNIC